jgi:hypothetical protein
MTCMFHSPILRFLVLFSCCCSLLFSLAAVGPVSKSTQGHKTNKSTRLGLHVGREGHPRNALDIVQTQDAATHRPEAPVTTGLLLTQHLRTRRCPLAADGTEVEDAPDVWSITHLTACVDLIFPLYQQSPLSCWCLRCDSVGWTLTDSHREQHGELQVTCSRCGDCT